MTAPKFVEVIRLEHVRCDTDPGHGPYYKTRRKNSSDWHTGTCSDAYGFGGVHSGPGSYIMPHEQCGVTWEQQFPHWCSLGIGEQFPNWYRNGWRFIRYVVPCEEARVYLGQVLFPTRDVYRSGELTATECAKHAPGYHDSHPKAPDYFYDYGAVHSAMEMPSIWINEPMKWSAALSSVSSL